MTKEDFFRELEDILEIENLTEDTPLSLSSLQVLGVIAFIDENFDKQVKASELRNIQSVSDLVSLIGITL
jgi:acyl carrier protein